MIFLDTDVMVDVLRAHPPAVAWLTSLGEEEILLSGFVTAELIQGCTSKEEQLRLTRSVSQYRVVWPESMTCSRALNVFSNHHLSAGLGIIDALIGQTAVDLGIPLHTFNSKHYACVPGLKTVRPYRRTGGST